MTTAPLPEPIDLSVPAIVVTSWRVWGPYEPKPGDILVDKNGKETVVKKPRGKK
jgi:hypothetical protein